MSVGHENTVPPGDKDIKKDTDPAPLGKEEIDALKKYATGM